MSIHLQLLQMEQGFRQIQRMADVISSSFWPARINSRVNQFAQILNSPIHAPLNHNFRISPPQSPIHLFSIFERNFGWFDFGERDAQIRQAFGVAPGEELYTGVVEATNAQRYQIAESTNQDGVGYLKGVLEAHLKSLNPKERSEWIEKIQENDPEIFDALPKLAVRKALSSASRLTQQNIPHFLHKYINQLEHLRTQPPSPEKTRKSDAIAVQVSRETDFIVPLQKALTPYQ